MPSSASIISVEVTPNPKPRKRTHTRTNSQQSIPSPTRKLVESPHISNPNADFVPPYLVSVTNSIGRRRSATPASIPPYEPPTDLDKFAPPREVFLTPSKPKPKQKRKSRGLKVEPVIVKTERPEDVDQTLHKPMPPPSPTDDPLLLKFNARRRSRKSKVKFKDVYEDTIVPLNRSHSESVLLPSPPPASPMKGIVPFTQVEESATEPIPSPSSPPSGEVPGVGYFAYPVHTPEPERTSDFEKESMDFAVSESLFPEGIKWTDDDDWGDSDSDEEFPAQESTESETFSDSLVPIRSSPPPGVSRNVHDSPHPRRSSVGSFIEEDQGTTVVGSDTHTDVNDNDEEEERQVREMSIPPAEEEVMDVDDGNPALDIVESSDDAKYEEQQVREMSLCPEPEDRSEETNVSLETVLELAPAFEPSAHKDNRTSSESKAFEISPSLSPSTSEEIVNEEVTDNELEQEADIVKITSADPLAAAKAAAILKQVCTFVLILGKV